MFICGEVRELSHPIFVRKANKHTLLMLDLVLYMGSWVMIKIKYVNPFEHVFHLTIVDMINDSNIHIYIYILNRLNIYIYISLSPSSSLSEATPATKAL